MSRKGGRMAYRMSLIANRQKQIWLLFTGYWLLISLFGCASIMEMAKGVAGVSTKTLEKNRKSAITKSFNYDYFSCYTMVLDIIKCTEAYIYAQDIKKHMIAIYVSKQDTTVVGVFFKEVDAKHTEVQVSSPSLSAKGLIATKLFSALEK